VNRRTKKSKKFERNIIFLYPPPPLLSQKRVKFVVALVVVTGERETEPSQRLGQERTTHGIQEYINGM
jgi:hypothetical protein